MTLWLAISFGFLTSSAASVKWKSAKLRIIEFADMMAMFAVIAASWVDREVASGDDVGVVSKCHGDRPLNSDSLAVMTSTWSLSSNQDLEHPSIIHQPLVDSLEAMEKDSMLLGADELPTRQSDEVHPRRSKRTNHAIVVVLLFFIATFWVTTVRPAFTIGRHGCTRKLTVEQRAARILKKHPLIGQHCRTTPHYIVC